MDDLETAALHDAAGALRQEWGIAVPTTLTEEAVIGLLAAKVVDWLERGPDAFYQLMYRLDISEAKLGAASAGEDIPRKIAQLIFDRQIQKARSRQFYRTQPKPPDEPDMRW